MFFKIVTDKSQTHQAEKFPCAFLIYKRGKDSGFVTQYDLVIFDESSKRHDIGEVKIGCVGMGKKTNNYHTNLESFEVLDENYFTLGQGDRYYINLQILTPKLRETILKNMRDIAFNTIIYQKVKNEDVLSTSLMRYISESEILHQYHRMAHGGARLTRYNYGYLFPGTNCKINFTITPGSLPPSNIQVIIGSNGTGKTTLLKRLSRLFRKIHTAEDGRLFWEPLPASYFNSEREEVANILHISDNIAENEAFAETTPSQIKYCPINSTHPHRFDLRDEIADKFASTFIEVASGLKLQLLKSAIKTIESDILFKQYSFSLLTSKSLKHNEATRCKIKKLFLKLSAGHKHIIYTLVTMVDLIEEQSLILFDEPELHLHPPLLSSFVRAMSNLLIERNGLAIIATHSPVVLQEVPSDCVWVLSRSGDEIKAERPRFETFGENVGILTREAFGLEVTESGFHKFLQKEVVAKETFEQLMERFDNKLGNEAQGTALILTNKDRNE